MLKLFFIVLCLSTHSMSHGNETAQTTLDCSQAVSTQDINHCTKIELDKKELELNQTYQQVLKQLDAVSKARPTSANQSTLKKQLVDAQRLWVRFRKADCDTVYTYWSDGTIRGAMYLSCMLNKTDTRIQELKAYTETY